MLGLFTNRNLPADLYGGYDDTPTSVGGRRFVLPHTLAYTTRSIAWPFQLMPVAFFGYHWWLDTSRSGSSVAAFRNNVIETIVLTVFSVASVFAVYWVIYVLLAVVGWRRKTSIEVRPDGIVIDDGSFFEASHVHGMMTTIDKGDNGLPNAFALTVTLGTQNLAIPELDPAAANLFTTGFQTATREMWHRQN